MYLGIDVGKTGAVGMVGTSGGYLNVFDMPIHSPVKKTKKSKPQYTLDTSNFYAIYNGIYVGGVTIEDIWGRPGESGSSVRNQDRLFGGIQAILNIHGITPRIVLPQVWKRHFGLIGKDKDASRLLALELFPEAKEQLKRKKDHNRSEALLIARYGWETRG